MSKQTITPFREGINLELGLAVADAIERHPRSFDLGWFDRETPECGSVMCYAGWICAMAGVKPFGSRYASTAVQLMGIYPEDISGGIFSFLPAPYGTTARRYQVGSPEYAKIAADRFRHFLQTGE